MYKNTHTFVMFATNKTQTTHALPHLLSLRKKEPPHLSPGARYLSGRMPDSQSSEPGFEPRFATISKIGHFRSLHVLNEYLAIDSGGNVNG